MKEKNNGSKEGLNDDTEVLDEFCIVPIASMMVTAINEKKLIRILNAKP